MKSSMRWMIAAPVLLLIGIGGGVLIATHFRGEGGASAENGETTDPSESTKDAGPIVPVRTATAALGEMVRTVEVYGTIIAQPGATHVTQLQSEVVVKRVLAQPGQRVVTSDPVCEVEPSPATKAELELGRAEVDSANKLLETAQQRQNMKLGTKQDLLQAQAAQHQAQVKLAQLEATLPDASGIVRAGVDGLVTEVHMEAGAVIAAGTALLQTVAEDAKVVQFGVESRDAAKIAVGQAIAIGPIDAIDAAPISATVQFISTTVDATTRLVNVIVKPPANATLRLGQGVRGAIEEKSSNALIVPRAAVLPSEDTYIVFTVQDGHAHEHVVQIGLQNHDAVEIIGGDLKAGDEVVTLGDYELDDGMPVKVETGP